MARPIYSNDALLQNPLLRLSLIQSHTETQMGPDGS